MNKNSLGAALRLVPITRNGAWADRSLSVNPEIVAFCTATTLLYEKVGFVEPWIGYIAAIDAVAVGGGAFVGPPEDSQVEIAYFTEQSRQNQGIAAAIATQLVVIAQGHSAELDIRAKTLPETNPSTRILTKLGFTLKGTEQDHEIGDAWAWVLKAQAM
ncbi:MAG: GNAT family N-acetyltransferase [Blastomonas sp.]